MYLGDNYEKNTVALAVAITTNYLLVNMPTRAQARERSHQARFTRTVTKNSPATSEALIYLATIRIMVRRLA